MRLFVGLSIPKKERSRIWRATKGLRDDTLPVEWTDPDNFHVTLKFLGEVRRDRLPEIQEALVKAVGATRAFSTGLLRVGGFPTLRRPKVLWLGVDPSPEFRCMKQDIEWAFRNVGFDVETRAFHPHVTLGVATSQNGGGAFRDLHERIADIAFDGQLRVHTVDLMRSHTGPEGTRYSVVSGARLAAS